MYGRKLVICYEWGELEGIKPIPWGYSLHLTPVHFIRFLKANQASRILRDLKMNILIEPIGRPYSCWASEKVHKILINNLKRGQWGSLHIGNPPQKYEIFEDLDLINALFSEGGQIERNFKDERLRESKRKLAHVLIEVDFINRKRKKA